MKKKLCLMFLTAVLIIGIAMARVGNASPEPVIQVEPKNNKAEPGDTFTVNITVTGIVIYEPPDGCNGLFGWQVWITFNPKVLNAVNATGWTFLKDAASQYNYTTIFLKSINNTSGAVKVGETIFPKMPPDEPYPPVGASGNGTLVTVTFEVKAQGATSIHFVTEQDKTSLRTILSNNVVEVEFTVEDGSFDNRKFVLSTELIVAIVVVVVVVCGAAVLFYRRRKPSA